MSLTLYFHPLSSYCQKVLIALYETGTPFDLTARRSSSNHASLSRLCASRSDFAGKDRIALPPISIV